MAENHEIKLNIRFDSRYFIVWKIVDGFGALAEPNCRPCSRVLVLLPLLSAPFSEFLATTAIFLPPGDYFPTIIIALNELRFLCVRKEVELPNYRTRLQSQVKTVGWPSVFLLLEPFGGMVGIMGIMGWKGE